ncbi:MAG: proline--tRNA ligase [Puniceicoccales bacterium]|jgi:prolyl-tRNA synthetase|nr:proline--tRNA ligase [Puniceicoccales bacterium]
MGERPAISPTRAENYAEWYQRVIRAADLAENAPVRGCMTIKPWGYAIWELIQSALDRMIKRTGHRNAYFPLLIPKSFLEREAAHVAGFAKECAVVTHTRLEQRDGVLRAAAPLEEPLVIRPTSEVLIGEAFSRWVRSHRDLPLLINQWANVLRWELRPRLFLRTAEFLWQEGHTAHATREEAEAEALRMLEVYRVLAEDFLAMPVVCGRKSAHERFPGAVETYSIEALMQDGKALQAGTSHFLGQNFSRACSIRFTAADGRENFAWTTSWGVSTRLIGGLIMVHSDDNGLVLPPRVAPLQVVILPILRGDGEKVLAAAERLRERLEGLRPWGQELRVEVDGRDLRGGEKNWEYVKKGVPIRVEIGPRDVEADQVTYARRDREGKWSLPVEDFLKNAVALLEEVQEELWQRALQLRRRATAPIGSPDELRAFFSAGNGFARTYFCEDEAVEKEFRETLGVTTRCFPLAEEAEEGPCFAHPDRPGRPALWARAY